MRVGQGWVLLLPSRRAAPYKGWRVGWGSIYSPPTASTVFLEPSLLTIRKGRNGRFLKEGGAVEKKEVALEAREVMFP